jgi:hypothetical protein
MPYVLVDGGTVWTKGRIDGRSAELSSVGLWLRFFSQSKALPISGFSLNVFVAKPLKTVDSNSSVRWVGLMSLIFKNIRLSASDLIRLRCPMTGLQDRFWVDVQLIVKALVDVNVNVN